MRACSIVRSFTALGGLGLAVMGAPHAKADSVAQLQIYKRLTAETIALIDPQGGTSMGGASTNVNYAIGDILTFRIAFTPVPNGATRGLGGYITEYVPANTEVVGARIVDKNGATVAPHRGGLGALGWGPRGAEGYTNPLAEGGIASLYADTGVFYSTDPRTARIPNDAFISLTNGTQLVPSPTGAGQFDQLLGITTNAYFAHNAWDAIQVKAFGVGGGALGNGTGNTPFGYGSAVAGPQTFYAFEATETSPGVVQATGTAGPWQRIRAPFAEIGTGVVATGVGPAGRPGVPTSAGFVLTADNPLPPTTNAVRFALGELVVGDEYFAEVSLRVLASPLDPVMNDDVNCTEVFGGDASSRRQDGSDGGKDNTWRYFVPSPSCVKLDLRFELDVDKVMALPSDTLTYTLTTQNLSLQPRTGVVVEHDLSTTGALMLISATGAPTVMGDVLTWPPVDLMPGDTVVQTIVADVSGNGDSTTSVATYTSDQLPAPGFIVQTLSNIQPIANLDLALSATPSSVLQGQTTTFTATVENTGTGVANVTGCSAPGCMYVATLPAGFTYVAGSATLNGATIPNPVVGADLRFSSGLVNVSPGATSTLSFDALVGAAVPDGVYTSTLQTWHRDPSAGRDIEDNTGATSAVLVNVIASEPPTVDAGIVAGDTQVCGSTTEPDGTTITVYVDLLPAGTGTSAASSYCVTVASLYAGQDVTATATNTAGGEVESAASSPPVVVLAASASFCADGLDNDGDGLIDFPDDPGCTGPGDIDETDVPECSDEVDNDGDGLIDFPDDPGCASYLDAVESGAPQCSDGVDNDGDGLTDFPDDADCESADDAIEQAVYACANGIDDDNDGATDYPIDPGCDSATDDSEVEDGMGGSGGAGGAAAGGGGTGAGEPGGPIENGDPPDLGGVESGSGGGSGEDAGCECETTHGASHPGGVVAWLVALGFLRMRRRSRA